MTLSLLTTKTVLLLTVCLLLSAFVSPFGAGLAVLPLAGLLIIHGHFLDLETLRVLTWVIIAVVSVSVFLITIWTFISAPWLTSALSSPNTFWPELLLGAAAGLRWPDRLLVPVLAPRVHRKLRIASNIVAIVLMACLFGFLIGLGGTWIYWLPWLDDWYLPRSVFRVIWGFGSFVSHLLIVSLLMASLAEWPGFTPQLRRVVIGGLSGVIVMIVLWQVLDGSLEAALHWLVRNDRTSYGAIGVLSLVFFSSTMVVSWLGITLGVWAGLRWPERLLLPANISGGTQRVRLAKNVTAVAVYVVLALLVHLTISLGMVFLVWD